MFLTLFFRQNIRHTDDSALLDLVRKNDSRAKSELFRRYAHLVLGLCIKYLKNKMEAEDEMMNIFLKLDEKIARHEITNFKSWLFTVTRNECLMILRKKGKSELDTDISNLNQTDSGDYELKLTELNDKKLSLLENSIQELRADQRQCIELFYLKNKSYEEIALQTNMELKNVKSHIQNGKRNLKIILEKHREFN